MQEEWQDKVMRVEIFACIFLFPLLELSELSLPQPHPAVFRGG